ncbi:YheC/YheD family protein [Cohnella sp. REN36]|uniref:YheC/YheD family protein n=1 Tax=Cohnella sp. REN36 TaxID=2887347 RepID=UPI001D13611A|nr:YheC/YheD family protein [Cohnella sp. REN36]MCC3375423.1 YheC/YheD family protein [Cohnella sp. REN36]
MTYGNNKWGKHRVMAGDAQLARHLPPTGPATYAFVRRMLGLYGSVYLKPSHGTGGFGIFRISRRNGAYELRYRTVSRSFASFDKAFGAFARAKMNKRYLAQKDISLLRHRGRPFDVRVMLQRGARREWTVTGIVGRLAGPRKIVTNYHSGGKPMQVAELLASSMSRTEREVCVNRMKSLSLRIGKRMSRSFPRFRAFGIDLGLDRNRKPWIIEVNSKPDKSIFRALADKRMYRTIMRFAKR